MRFGGFFFFFLTAARVTLANLSSLITIQSTINTLTLHNLHVSKNKNFSQRKSSKEDF